MHLYSLDEYVYLDDDRLIEYRWRVPFWVDEGDVRIVLEDLDLLGMRDFYYDPDNPVSIDAWPDFDVGLIRQWFVKHHRLHSNADSPWRDLLIECCRDAYEKQRVTPEDAQEAEQFDEGWDAA